MTEHRVAPGATKSESSSPVESLHPTRLLTGLRNLLQGETTGPASGEPASPPGTGVEPPLPIDTSGEPLAVGRTFAFVDICGFTGYCDREGEHAAIELLTRFREAVRDIVGRRGVRVAKWLGDGVMLVGTEEGPIVAGVAELVIRAEAAGIDVHAGIAAGTVLMFEGDDYVGRPVNLAARLCDAAEQGEVLAVGLHDELPEWVEVVQAVTVEAGGVGAVNGVSALRVCSDVAESFRSGGAAA